MKLKAFIQNLITTDIRNATPKVRKAKHADIEDSLLDEIYPTPYDESSATPFYTIPVAGNTNFPYFLKLTKKGRRMFLDGWVRNGSGFTASQTFILEIPATVVIGGNTVPNPILPDVTVDPATGSPFVYRFEATETNSEGIIRLIVLYDPADSKYKIRISGNFPANYTTGSTGKYYFNSGSSYNVKS